MFEIARVLKPSGGWATVVFRNTDAEVWQAIRDAADEAGFVFHEAASLERQQQSHKGYKGRSGAEDVAHFDVVFNLQKTSPAAASKSRRAKTVQVDLAKLIARIVKRPRDRPAWPSGSARRGHAPDGIAGEQQFCRLRRGPDYLGAPSHSGGRDGCGGMTSARSASRKTADGSASIGRSGTAPTPSGRSLQTAPALLTPLRSKNTNSDPGYTTKAVFTYEIASR